MRLYTMQGASSVHNEEHGDFEVAEDGSVEVPDALGVVLHRTHIGGKQAWETDAERHGRFVAEELERRKDPATLLAAVEALTTKIAPDTEPAPAGAPAPVQVQKAPAQKATARKAPARRR